MFLIIILLLTIPSSQSNQCDKWPEDPWNDYDSPILPYGSTPTDFDKALKSYGIECRNLSHICLDYNNLMIMFSRKYEHSGRVPDFLAPPPGSIEPPFVPNAPPSVGPFQRLPVQNLRAFKGLTGDAIFGGRVRPSRLEVRLATPYEERHLSAPQPHPLDTFSSNCQATSNHSDGVGASGHGGWLADGLVLVHDWADNFGHTWYAAARLAAARHAGLLSFRPARRPCVACDRGHAGAGPATATAGGWPAAVVPLSPDGAGLAGFALPLFAAATSVAPGDPFADPDHPDPGPAGGAAACGPPRVESLSQAVAGGRACFDRVPRLPRACSG